MNSRLLETVQALRSTKPYVFIGLRRHFLNLLSVLLHSRRNLHTKFQRSAGCLLITSGPLAPSPFNTFIMLHLPTYFLITKITLQLKSSPSSPTAQATLNGGVFFELKINAVSSTGLHSDTYWGGKGIFCP